MNLFCKSLVLPFCFFFATVSEAEPVPFRIRGQIGHARRDSVQKEIFIPVGYYGKHGVFPLGHAFVESKGGCDIPDTVDLRTPFRVTIDGTEWKVRGGYQLPGSRFDSWHAESVRGFATFGHVDCSEMVGSERQRIWDNGNPAYSTSGSKNWPTKRIALKDESLAAELTTRKVFGVIASGSLFTGRIVREMSLKQLLGFTDKDGKALIRWGVPFEARPRGFRVKFKYEGLGDSCTVMATLENRQDGIRRFVGVAWYSDRTDSNRTREGVESISKPDANGLRTLTAKFIYGKGHKNADPLPEGAVQGKADEPITHVNVVFASSRKGDYFEGNKDARLIVKDFEFVY